MPEINKTNILHLAKVLESGELAKSQSLGFNMGTWGCRASFYFPDLSGHNGGTVACIGGTAEIIWPDEHPRDSLGLNSEQEEDLFYPEFEEGSGRDLYTLSLQEAVDVLRAFAATGEVNWGEGFIPFKELK